MAKAFISGVDAVVLQEKVVDVTENGTVEVIPDEGKLLRKVTAVVNVKGSSDEPDEPTTPEYSKGLLIEWDNDYRCYVVNGRGDCTDSVVVIPDSFDDGVHGEAPVTRLGYTKIYNPDKWTYETVYVFYEDETLVEIYLPSSGMALSNSFSLTNCPNLKKVYGVGSMYSFELANLPSLEYVEFAPSTEWISGGIGSGNGVVYDFTKCTSVPSFDSYGFGSEFGTDPVILVPDVLLSEWEQATNWAIYSDYITSPSNANTQKKTVTYDTSGVYEILPDAGKLLRKVIVNVSAGGVQYSEGLSYFYNDGSYLIMGDGDWVGEDLIIPPTHDDGTNGEHPVDELGFSIFGNNTMIKSATLPETIDLIGATIFENCPNLTHLYIPYIRYVASFCVWGLTGLEYVKFKDISSIEGGNFAGGNKFTVYDFKECTSIPTLECYEVGEQFGENPIIRVPASLLDEWKSATNWTLYADYIVAGA